MTSMERLRDRWTCWCAVADARDDSVNLAHELDRLRQQVSTLIAMNEEAVRVTILLVSERDRARRDLADVLYLRDVREGEL